MTDRAGQVLGGRYRLLERIGAGGMSEVYRAEHVELGRPLAVKLLLPAIAADEVAVERLRREAMATSNLGHPNIVQIADFDHAEDGAAYLVMEWLEGETLEEHLARGDLLVEEGAELLAQACDALGAAHAAGVIHRDVKPANLFVTRDRAGHERLVVLDFGIAKLGDDQHLTRTGTFVGTPDYMSPEQAAGDQVDRRTDVYSVGVILYELVAGELPFTGSSVMEILHHKITEVPVPPGERAGARPVSPALEEVILRCLARDPGERYQEADELAEEVRKALRDPAASPNRRTSRDRAAAGRGQTGGDERAMPTGGGSHRHAAAVRDDTEEPAVPAARPPVWAFLLVLALTGGALYGGVYLFRSMTEHRGAIEPARTEAQIRVGDTGLVATVGPLPLAPERPMRVRVDLPEGGAAEVAARFAHGGAPAGRPEYEARLPVSGGSVTFGLVPRGRGPHRMILTVFDEGGAEIAAGGFGVCVGAGAEVTAAELCPELALTAPDAPGPLFP